MDVVPIFRESQDEAARERGISRINLYVLVQSVREVDVYWCHFQVSVVCVLIQSFRDQSRYQMKSHADLARAKRLNIADEGV